jgi:hypothetical protein
MIKSKSWSNIHWFAIRFVHTTTYSMCCISSGGFNFFHGNSNLPSPFLNITVGTSIRLNWYTIFFCF